MVSAGQTLASTATLLKTRVSRYAVYGVLIALVCIALATLLVTYFSAGSVSLQGIIDAQKTNYALWILDIMPFVFAFWGQYTSSVMAYEAGVAIIDQTSDLRARAAALEEKAVHDAAHDHLTSLPNRTLLYDRIQQALSVAQRERNKLAVLMMDLDNFREINDTLGHHNGDLLLKQVALRLQGAIRNIDTVARMGGDEFAILLSKITNEDDTNLVANKLLSALEPSFNIGGLKLDVQASIGIAWFPKHGPDAHSLLQRAEIAMYAAKTARSGFAMYSPEHDQSSPRRLTLMGELRRAIENEELQVYYQPKVDLKTSQVVEVEALVRWPHSEHGLMPPDEFIPLAERTGLIKPLTMLVLNRSLEQIAIWHRQGYRMSVAVNLSARVLLDPQLPDLFAGLLASHEVKPEWLNLEITESAIMADQARGLEILTRLHELGVKLAIDDFGTGYSSLSYLKRLPVHEVKIDKSFVMDMRDDENDAVIVRATIDLAHNMGLRVVAEGVKNQQIWNLLEILGCDFAQGEFISIPLSVEDLQHWMLHSRWPVQRAPGEEQGKTEKVVKFPG